MSNVFEYAYGHNKKVITWYDGDACDGYNVVRREGKLWVDFGDCLINADELDIEDYRIK